MEEDMELTGNIEIRFGRKIWREKDLRVDRKRWRKWRISPSEEYSDEENIRRSLYQITPVTLLAKYKPVRLRATLTRHPYVIIDEQRPRRKPTALMAFGLRLVPEMGELITVRLHDEEQKEQDRVAVNFFHKDEYDKAVYADFGNGSLRLEVLYRPTKDEFGPVPPPFGFSKKVVLSKDRPDLD